MRHRQTLLKAAFVSVVALLAYSVSQYASAQVVDANKVGIPAPERSEVTMGWSAKHSILGKPVYNERDERIGNVEDLIVTPTKHLSYLIVGAGGFVGIGRHDVAVPMSRIRELGGKIVFVGATKENIKAMPQFDYASDTVARSQFISRAEQDIADAKTRIGELQDQADRASAEANVRIYAQVTGLRQDTKAVEDQLAALKKAGSKKWKEFAADLNVATYRLRESLKKGVG